MVTLCIHNNLFLFRIYAACPAVSVGTPPPAAANILECDKLAHRLKRFYIAVVNWCLSQMYGSLYFLYYRVRNGKRFVFNPYVYLFQPRPRNNVLGPRKLPRPPPPSLPPPQWPRPLLPPQPPYPLPLLDHLRSFPRSNASLPSARSPSPRPSHPSTRPPLQWPRPRWRPTPPWCPPCWRKPSRTDQTRRRRRRNTSTEIATSATRGRSTRRVKISAENQTHPVIAAVCSRWCCPMLTLPRPSRSPSRAKPSSTQTWPPRTICLLINRCKTPVRPLGWRLKYLKKDCGQSLLSLRFSRSRSPKRWWRGPARDPCPRSKGTTRRPPSPDRSVTRSLSRGTQTHLTIRVRVKVKTIRFPLKITRFKVKI